MAFEKLKEKWQHEEAVAVQNAALRKAALLRKGHVIFERYGVHKAVVFGSVARGKSSKFSDIDIYATPVAQENYWRFRADLEEALGYPVDVYTEHDSSNLIKRAVQAGEVIYEI